MTIILFTEVHVKRIWTIVCPFGTYRSLLLPRWQANTKIPVQYNPLRYKNTYVHLLYTGHGASDSMSSVKHSLISSWWRSARNIYWYIFFSHTKLFCFWLCVHYTIMVIIWGKLSYVSTRAMLLFFRLTRGKTICQRLTNQEWLHQKKVIIVLLYISYLNQPIFQKKQHLKSRQLILSRIIWL